MLWESGRESDLWRKGKVKENFEFAKWNDSKKQRSWRIFRSNSVFSDVSSVFRRRTVFRTNRADIKPGGLYEDPSQFSLQFYQWYPTTKMEPVAGKYNQSESIRFKIVQFSKLAKPYHSNPKQTSLFWLFFRKSKLKM